MSRLHLVRVRVAAIAAVLCVGWSGSAFGQIPKPGDAPAPLSPAEAAKAFKLPAGFRIELVAAEPLVREPSGVCWDERGRLFVCELHGYNLEGQYDIEELNKTGQLDRVVRRIQANEEAKRAAEAETYGTIKLLRDTDGDGTIDRADVWADRLPACHGICPALGGIIATGQTQILFLADRNGDDKAEVREVLFEGFAKGPLERSLNCPQWGPDNWIYVGAGAGGGTITGVRLKTPVEMPRTDFRIKPDGTAIEPVVGATHTMGFAFTESGDRFVISTRTPGIFVAPLPWRYLARNPDVATPSLEQNGTNDQHVHPTSAPHPWRTRRASDPGFSKYYSDRYGIQESAPNGYFTSACSPLVYQDDVLPGLRGQLLACEPAQNLIHRAIVERDGSQLILKRPPGEEQSEFLTSSDPWFHAISLAHAPDGTIYIVDFYREIIEDYSAIPRYLQQQYGLMNGQNHGRIWRLTHAQAKDAPPADMSRLTPVQLADEVTSPHYWRRQTARRLLAERRARQVLSLLSTRVRAMSEPYAIVNCLQTLDGIGELKPSDVLPFLSHNAPEVRRQALQLAEQRFKTDPALLGEALKLADDEAPLVRLQAALSLGETRDARAIDALLKLGRAHADELWMTPAILSSVSGRAGELLAELVREPEKLGKAEGLLAPLAAAISSRRDPGELSAALVAVAQLGDRPLQTTCLRGFLKSLPQPVSVELSEPARAALKSLASGTTRGVQEPALALVAALRVESAAERQARLTQAARDLKDVQLPAAARLAAVAQLGAENDPSIAATRLAALSTGTPQVRESILNAIFSRRERLPAVLDALEQKTIAPAVLSAVQRAALFDVKGPRSRDAIAALLKTTSVSDETFQAYAQALAQPRDLARGQQVFREKCGICHEAHGVGVAVGPDLSAEFQRAEETILRDVLAPGDSLSAGYVTYSVQTTSGQVASGLLSSESPTSITLRQAEGKEQVILRKDIEELKALAVSLMPEDLPKTVSPKDLADVLGWLRRPPVRLVLLDENPAIVEALNEGDGTAEFITADKHAGQGSLRITPPQRHAPRIKGWEFRIRENPGPGEYRYLRFAWKAPEAQGVMIELAASGNWPPAQKPIRRYYAGKNTTGWQAVEVSAAPPADWTVVTRDLWKDFGDFTLTGIAPTAMGGPALFDRIELRQSPE
jgi:putative membrane-bound dehydrogenase-like protein